jgi:hypothetical protein
VKIQDYLNSEYRKTCRDFTGMYGLIHGNFK